MAKVEDHIRQWKHNRDFLATISPAFPDWLVTASFYVALQAVDAVLAHDKVKNINSHSDRNDVLLRTNRYEAIWMKYRPLYDLARTVRYLASPAQWVPYEQIEQNVIRRYVYPIEKSAQKLMGEDLKLPLISLVSAPPKVSQRMGDGEGRSSTPSVT